MKKSLPMIAQICMLPITPTNSKEAHNRLCALEYLDKIDNPNYERDIFSLRKYSRRRERLVKMYWAFRKLEAAKQVKA